MSWRRTRPGKSPVRSDGASVGVLLADLHFPANRSLKDKRAPLHSLRDVVQGRFKASFSEVGGHEQWQVARVLITLAASSPGQAGERVDEIERYLFGREFEVARVLLKAVDPVETLWDIDLRE
jgi:uncharacterized protein YlxP (DUF503 family)